MEHIETKNLTGWLEAADSAKLDARDHSYLRSLTQYLSNPAKYPYVFLDGRIFAYAFSLDGQNHSLVSHVINVTIRDVCHHDNQCKPHVFRLHLRSISDFQHKFCACAGNVILMQFYTEPRKNQFDISTFLLDLSNDTVKAIEERVPVISKAYGGATEDYFYFTDVYRPSVLSTLNINTHQQKILKACFLKRWVATAVVRPIQNGGTPEMAGIVSEDKGLWENPSASGLLVTFDVSREQVISKREDILACAELLKYSNQGDVLMTYQKLPTQVYFLDPDDLSTLKVFTFEQYFPFLQLPLRMPQVVDMLQDNGGTALDDIQAGKVIMRNGSIRGLSLLGDKMRFLIPMCHRARGVYMVAHIGLLNSEESQVGVINAKHMEDNHNDSSVIDMVSEPISVQTTGSKPTHEIAQNDVFAAKYDEKQKVDTVLNTAAQIPIKADQTMYVSPHTDSNGIIAKQEENYNHETANMYVTIDTAVPSQTIADKSTRMIAQNDSPSSNDQMLKNVGEMHSNIKQSNLNRIASGSDRHGLHRNTNLSKPYGIYGNGGPNYQNDKSLGYVLENKLTDRSGFIVSNIEMNNNVHSKVDICNNRERRTNPDIRPMEKKIPQPYYSSTHSPGSSLVNDEAEHKKDSNDLFGQSRSAEDHLSKYHRQKPKQQHYPDQIRDANRNEGTLTVDNKQDSISLGDDTENRFSDVKLEGDSINVWSDQNSLRVRSGESQEDLQESIMDHSDSYDPFCIHSIIMNYANRKS